jgi:hypothetical protein
MPDFRKMTVQRLRDLAKKSLGPGHSRLKTKGELVAALEEAEGAGSRASPAPGTSRTSAAKPQRAAAKPQPAPAKTQPAAAKTQPAAARPEPRKQPAPPRAKGARVAAKAVKGAAGALAGAVAGAVAGVAASTRPERPARRPPVGPDPEGFFVARVRGEEAVRESPHPMSETAPPEPEEFREIDEGTQRVGPYDEGLGDLPWSYGDDAFVALPRDPRTLFLYWDVSRATLDAAFAGLDHPRAQLWIFAQGGGGWDRLRAIEFALESRGYYVHDLEPGRTYRAEIHAIDRAGRDRLVGRPSNELALPPVGPSPVVDDRFIRIPWDLPLGQLLGPGHPGGPFSDEARALLARLSDWSRFGKTWGGSAGGIGGRPSSPVGPAGGRED